ncbi:MAG: GTP cyclohydrolase [Capnocytophaga sp.]|nr:GTP cyclohydrolase [Capnocytophaga sp.]
MKKKVKKIPNTLEECLSLLDKILSSKDRLHLKTLTEDEFSIETHFDLGAGIRNEWLRQQNSPLLAYFYEMGISHLDDMSSIILTSYYRNITGKPIDLQGQLEYYKAYWEEKNKEK